MGKNELQKIAEDLAIKLYDLKLNNNIAETNISLNDINNIIRDMETMDFKLSDNVNNLDNLSNSVNKLSEFFRKVLKDISFKLSDEILANRSIIDSSNLEITNALDSITTLNANLEAIRLDILGIKDDIIEINGRVDTNLTFINDQVSILNTNSSDITTIKADIATIKAVLDL